MFSIDSLVIKFGRLVIIVTLLFQEYITCVALLVSHWGVAKVVPLFPIRHLPCCSIQWLRSSGPHAWMHLLSSGFCGPPEKIKKSLGLCWQTVPPLNQASDGLPANLRFFDTVGCIDRGPHLAKICRSFLAHDGCLLLTIFSRSKSAGCNVSNIQHWIDPMQPRRPVKCSSRTHLSEFQSTCFSCPFLAPNF